MKKVLVSGCFDMLHSGHVAFFQRAAACGDDLIVALGSDQIDLKPPINSEEERRSFIEPAPLTPESRFDF